MSISHSHLSDLAIPLQDVGLIDVTASTYRGNARRFIWLVFVKFAEQPKKHHYIACGLKWVAVDKYRLGGFWIVPGKGKVR